MNDTSLNYFFHRNFRKILFFSFLYLIYSLIETLSIGSIYPLISSILNPGAPIDQSIFINIILKIQKLIPVNDTFIAAAITLILLNIVNLISSIVVDTFALIAKYKIYEKTFNEIFSLIIKKKYSYFQKKRLGDILFVGFTAAQAEGEIFHYFPRTIAEILRVIVMTIFLFTISFKITLILLGLIVLATLGYIFLAGHFIYPWSVELRKESENINSGLTEMVLGISDIKLFNLGSFFSSLYSTYTAKFRKVSISAGIVNFLPNKIGTLGLPIGASLAIIITKLLYPESFMEILTGLTVYYVVLQKMLPAINNIGINWMGLKSLSPRLEVIKSTIEDDDFETRQGTSATPDYPNIHLTNLDFSYETKKIINNINTLITSNQTTALVGPSGGGKSTLIKLLSTTLIPTHGTIRINDIPLTQIDLDDWRKNIAIVSQEPYLFHLSIFENIRLGDLNASKDEVIEASKQANAHDFIIGLENGYDTHIGERGAKISGGQKQRIALARALLKKPKVLLLDEATSALDNISEKAIQETLFNLKGQMTIIIVAHRLSTIISADQILVIKEGEIVEQGSHQQLINMGGEYARMYQTQ